MIANHPIYGQNYSYHIRGDRSPLTFTFADFSTDANICLLVGLSDIGTHAHPANTIQMLT